MLKFIIIPTGGKKESESGGREILGRQHPLEVQFYRVRAIFADR